MDQFHQFIIKNAFTNSHKDLLLTDIKNALKILDPDYMGAGFNTRVFITKDKKWVIKEGRWDLDLDMFSYGGFKFPMPIASFLMYIFNREFVPKKEVIVSQYHDYQIFLSYLGYSNGNIVDKIVEKRQKEIRDDLPESLQRLKKRLRLRLTNEQIKELLRFQYENLLPKEYLLYGEPISKENNLRPTYYIVQEYIEGKLFHDSQIKNMKRDILLKLVLLACLVLIMYEETGRIPDMRPRYIINEPMNWFSRTDNIIINHEKVYFVDTRLLWNSHRGPIKRGLIIPEMTRRSSKAFINHASKILSRSLLSNSMKVV